MKAWFFVWGLALAALSGSVWSSTGADAAPESLVAGQTVSGHIDLAEYDTYTFDGASNDVAYLMVLRTGGTGTYPRLYLYDPVGALVFDIFTTSNYARIPALRLTRSGTYTVAVSDDRWQESFDYVLAFHWIHGEADPREPGDPPEALEAGKIVEGYLGQADIDTFTFNASSNDVVHYAIVGTNGAGGSLFCYLYNSEGKQVATGNRKTNLTLTNSGTYTLVVLDSAVEGNFHYVAAYHLAGSAPAPLEPGDGPAVLEAGQFARGHLGPADYDTFTFNAASNDVILLAVVATNSLPDIIFFDPDGVPVTANFINFVFGNTGGVRLAKSGVYTLGLFQQSGVTDYVFSFNLAKGGANQREAGDGPETLVPGQPVGGHIDRADFDTFSFSAASNDVVHAILKRTGDFRSPYLYLYGPNGTWLGSFSGGPNDTRISNFRLTASGIYTLAVFDGASGGSFDYQLTFHLANGGTSQNEPDDGPEFLEAGQSSGGHLALADYDSFTFSATSNDVAILTVLPTNGVACCPGIFLYGPDGVPITANLTNFGVARTATVRLPMSGVYTLGLLEQVGVMDYVVSFHLAKGGANQREAGDGPEAIAAGQITGGHIGPADYDSFTFNAASNEVLYLTVLRTNGPGAFPYIYLYDPNGTAVIGGSSGSNDARIVNRRLTSTGTYRLLILDDRLQETFDYLVTFNLAQGGINLREDGDGGEVILPGQTVSGHIQPGDYDTFTFSAASNDVIYATVRRKVGPGDFPYIYLYDPDGAVILNGFTSIMDYVHIPGLRLARNGTYTLAVLDDKMTEQFDYSVSLILIPGPNATDPGDGAAFLAAGESRVANLSPGDLDGFSVRAIAGDLLDVTLRSISGPARYPVLRIHAPNGAIVGLDIQLTNARVRLPCVQQSGNYTILVWDDTFGESMTYQLELRQSPVVPRSDGTNQFLAACACADRVVIRWETNAQAAGFQLETTSLAPDDSWPAWMDSAEWKPVNEPYLVISDHFYFVDSVSQTNRFYRLRRPSPP